MGSIRIREEDTNNPGELASIRAVNTAAFGGPAEADLVDELRTSGHALVLLVAELNSEIVGHIVFSRMWIETPRGKTSAVALAPVAVHPDHQRCGIGSQLIRRGLELLRGHGENIVIVLGHPEYYTRFGFSTNQARQLQSPFPPEAYMALELTPGALDGVHGQVVYPPAFGI